MESVGLYTDARNEYMKQLCMWIVPPLVDFFRVEYNALVKTHGKKTMSAFQTFCAEVPKWNQDVIETHINSVLDGCRCDYVEELMTAVFVAHTKMLTAIRTNGKQKKLQITLPKLDHFLHRVFTECARSLWKAPFLFAAELSSVERQKNILQAESMCSEAMSSAVRSLLPVKNILREYLDEDAEGEDTKSSEGKEEAEPFGTKTMGTLDLVEETESTETAVTAVATEEETETAAVAAVATEEETETATGAAGATGTAAAATVVDKDSVPSTPSPSFKAKSPKPSLLLTKVETPPELATPAGSEHVVALPTIDAGVTVEKSDTVPTRLTIETEPTVHFTPYDTVFQDTSGLSELEYKPKVSVEDKPPSSWGLTDDTNQEDGGGPTLTIHESSTSIGAEEVEDLEAPVKPAEEAKAVEEDIDAPLSSTADFEELS